MKAAKTAVTPSTGEARAISDIAPFLEVPDAAPVWLISEAVEVTDGGV